MSTLSAPCISPPASLFTPRAIRRVIASRSRERPTRSSSLPSTMRQHRPCCRSATSLPAPSLPTCCVTAAFSSNRFSRSAWALRLSSSSSTPMVAASSPTAAITDERVGADANSQMGMSSSPTAARLLDSPRLSRMKPPFPRPTRSLPVEFARLRMGPGW